MSKKFRKHKKKHLSLNNLDAFLGAAGQIRTADLILTKDALYLLSYSSKYGNSEGAFPPSSG